MNAPDDPELEAFLRQFRPRTPAALPPPRARGVARRWILAAAATVLLAAAVWQLAPAPDIAPPPAPTLTSAPAGVRRGAVHLAVGAGTHETLLDQVNARTLPDPSRPGGALSVLGNVSLDLREPGAGRTR